jgi:hypothetical protein
MDRSPRPDISRSVISPSSSPGPAPSPGPLRPFSKKGVGYYGGKCSDFEAGGLDNVSWGYDWGHDKASLARSGCAWFIDIAEIGNFGACRGNASKIAGATASHAYYCHSNLTGITRPR